VIQVGEGLGSVDRLVSRFRPFCRADRRAIHAYKQVVFRVGLGHLAGFSMDLPAKLSLLADAAKYDASCASSGTNRRNARAGGLGSTTGAGICHSYTPDGRCVSLLKILLTNFCIYDCQYCINRVSSDVARARFTPEEVVNLTLDFYRRNYIEGLFLSSGIIRNPDYTMEQVVKVARLLRETHQFRGYIHLKTIPEAAPELIAEAGRWADRLSINVELPTPEDLERLAPDRQILAQASSLYREHRLRRVYYSAFSPIPDASRHLPLVAPPLVREHRLYQADWLLRFYGFEVEELTSEQAPDLPLGIDPKLAWALRHPERFPVDLHTAPREVLLRLPGLGVRNVDRLLQVRRWHRVTLPDLARLRVPLRKIMPFIVTSDHRPAALPTRLATVPVRQGELFAPEPAVFSSQW
jgi:predicted DNA-binding helix-hairpin-helix protein